VSGERLDRTAAILGDIARFAASAKRVADRGRERFFDPADDEQRRIARSLAVDLSTAADRLPAAVREAHPEIRWAGIRALRNFIAHDYEGTDNEVLWSALTTSFAEVAAALAASGPPERG
jgi:uncharacterized protein with HEPN domain